MDAKEATTIKHFYDKVISLSFDEKDVFTFLILLRPYSPKKSPAYEFSNFAAHREKDRGYIYDYMLSSKSFFNQIGTKVGDLHELKSVFTEQGIHDSIDSVIKSLGLAPFSEVAAAAIQLCIISLLQDVTISDKTNAEVARMLFAFDKTDIYLMGRFSVTDFPPHSHLQVPVLQMKNRYLKTESSELRIPGIVEIAFTNGALKVMVWEEDSVQQTKVSMDS